MVVMRMNPIKIAVTSHVLTDPHWASPAKGHKVVTEIFNRITTPMGRLLNILTGGLYGYFTKREIQRTLRDAQRVGNAVTFKSDEFSPHRPRRLHYKTFA